MLKSKCWRVQKPKNNQRLKCIPTNKHAALFIVLFVMSNCKVIPYDACRVLFSINFTLLMFLVCLRLWYALNACIVHVCGFLFFIQIGALSWKNTHTHTDPDTFVDFFCRVCICVCLAVFVIILSLVSVSDLVYFRVVFYWFHHKNRTACACLCAHTLTSNSLHPSFSSLLLIGQIFHFIYLFLYALHFEFVVRLTHNSRIQRLLFQWKKKMIRSIRCI